MFSFYLDNPIKNFDIFDYKCTKQKHRKTGYRHYYIAIPSTSGIFQVFKYFENLGIDIGVNILKNSLNEVGVFNNLAIFYTTLNYKNLVSYYDIVNCTYLDSFRALKKAIIEQKNDDYKHCNYYVISNDLMCYNYVRDNSNNVLEYVNSLVNRLKSIESILN